MRCAAGAVGRRSRADGRVVRSAAARTPAYPSSAAVIRACQPATSRQATSTKNPTTTTSRPAPTLNKVVQMMKAGSATTNMPTDRAEAAADPLDDVGHGIILTAATAVWSAGSTS